MARGLVHAQFIKGDSGSDATELLIAAYLANTGYGQLVVKYSNNPRIAPIQFNSLIRGELHHVILGLRSASKNPAYMLKQALIFFGPITALVGGANSAIRLRLAVARFAQWSGNSRRDFAHRRGSGSDFLRSRKPNPRITPHG
jgi:hypothetical protein